MGIRTDKIQQCSQNFLHLVSTTKYVFHVAKRGVKVLTLDFDLKDFHHLVGLQYLDDINIGYGSYNYSTKFYNDVLYSIGM